MGRFWKSFFWGPPSHKRIAWAGALAGVGVLALAAVVVGKAHPLFVLAVLLLGVAEFGWARRNSCRADALRWPAGRDWYAGCARWPRRSWRASVSCGG